jgi:hypothetical protein
MQRLDPTTLRTGDAGAAADGAPRLPDTVGETILRRAERLTAQTQRLLGVAALLGREFDVALLAATARLDPASVDVSIREAQDASVVSPLGEGRYLFSHALVQSTLAAAIDEHRRARLHRLAAEALEALYPDEPPVAAIAHHLLAALPDADRGLAVRYAWRAGDVAARQLADDQAIAHYGRAIEAARDGEHCDDAVLLPADASRLYLALGEAHLRMGRVDRARLACAEAARCAREVPDPVLFARAALAFGGGADVSIGFEYAGRDDELLSLLDEARSTLPVAELAMRATVSARLAGARYDSGEFAAADRLTAEAVALARQSGDTCSLAYALAARHAAVWRPDSLVERLAIGHELSTLDTAAGTPLALQGYVWRVADVLECGDVAAADAQVAKFDAGMLPGAHPRFRWYSTLYRGMRSLLDGRLDDFAAEYEEARALGIRAGAYNVGTSYAAQSFFGARERGELAGLASLLDAFADSQPEQAAWRVGAVLARAESGDDVDAARQALAALAVDDFAVLPDDGLWLANAVLLADASASLGATDEAAILYRLLAPYRDRVVFVSRILVCLGSVENALARLATTIGEHDLARSYLALARAKHKALDAPLLVARTDLADIALRRATGDDVGARAVAADVAATAKRHGWTDVAARARG